MREKRELTLIDEKQIRHNIFIYIFKDREGNAYCWKTAKEHWFRKKEWWHLSFEYGNTVDGIQTIEKVHYVKK